MNKFSKNLHSQFISGKINGAIYNYMSSIASSVDDASLDGHIEKLATLGIQTVEDCTQYFNIYANVRQNLQELINANVSNELHQKVCEYGFLNKSKYNFENKYNYSKLVLDFIKQSHPNNMGIESALHVKAPYNLDKWIETMRQIYDTANTNNLPLDSIEKQVTAQWSEDEKDHFQRWMKYYQEGNYNKYNVKTAQYFPFKQEAKTPDPDMKQVKDIVEAPPKVDLNAEKKIRLDKARKSLRQRLKSVEELVEAYRDVLPKDLSAIIRKDVYELKEKVFSLELKASIVDSINRTSNQLKKHGFSEGAQELKKIAQEVAQDKLPEAPAPELELAPEPQAAAPEAPVEAPKDENQVRVPEVNIGEDSIEIPDFSSATHRDALQKLEEINKVISERNVVRALAAVDIILGQLGIASYFPQLSEAQSKMMDAFNYAGSRVAETIGQMRGGSGGPANAVEKKPEETVEVSEEVEKPVGEIVTGPPTTPPAATPTPEVK